MPARPHHANAGAAAKRDRTTAPAKAFAACPEGNEPLVGRSPITATSRERTNGRSRPTTRCSTPSVTVLLNVAGGGAGKPTTEAAIAALFLAARIEAQILVLPRGRDPGAAARTASARTTVVVAAGGDGTVGGVAAGLVGTSTVLGV